MFSVVVCVLLGLGPWTQSPEKKASTPTALSFSTQSAEAREALQRGIVEWENHRMADAASDFRKAAQADANFAVAHLFLSTLTPKPEEQRKRNAKGPGLKRLS